MSFYHITDKLEEIKSRAEYHEPILAKIEATVKKDSLKELPTLAGETEKGTDLTGPAAAAQTRLDQIAAENQQNQDNGQITYQDDLEHIELEKKAMAQRNIDNMMERLRQNTKRAQEQNDAIKANQQTVGQLTPAQPHDVIKTNQQTVGQLTPAQQYGKDLFDAALRKPEEIITPQHYEDAAIFIKSYYDNDPAVITDYIIPYLQTREDYKDIARHLAPKPRRGK